MYLRLDDRKSSEKNKTLTLKAYVSGFSQKTEFRFHSHK